MIKRYYSAFAHGPLDLMLRSRGIKSVLLTGGAVLGAVESAAKESYVRGYYLVLVSDCVVPDSGPDHEIVMKHGSGKLGAIVATAEEIIGHWNSLAAGKRRENHEACFIDPERGCTDNLLKSPKAYAKLAATLGGAFISKNRSLFTINSKTQDTRLAEVFPWHRRNRS